MSAFLMSQAALSNLAFEIIRQLDNGRAINWRKLLGEQAMLPNDEQAMCESMFQLLLRQNLDSLTARYGVRANQERDLAARWAFEPPSVAYRAMPLDVGWICSLCACYDYQACETESYAGSAAHSLVKSTKTAAMSTLVKWPENVWGEEHPHYLVD